MSDFKQLRVWQRAHQVALAVYRLTMNFPPSERFGLVSQMRRAATSISANVAESSGRYSVRDQARFLNIAKGSAKELECHLILVSDLGIISGNAAAPITKDLLEIQRMLSVMIRNSELSRS